MNIMFVCTGNTCRSPMAEQIAKIWIQKNNVDDQVFSCGIRANEGMPASLGAQAAIQSMGGDLSKHHAKAVSLQVMQTMDRILCMEATHMHSLLLAYPELSSKTYTLLGFIGETGDIYDPYGGDHKVYTDALTSIAVAVERALEKIAHPLG